MKYKKLSSESSLNSFFFNLLLLTLLLYTVLLYNNIYTGLIFVSKIINFKLTKKYCYSQR
jgi:hypothetical protein